MYTIHNPDRKKKKKDWKFRSPSDSLQNGEIRVEMKRENVVQMNWLNSMFW